MRLLNATFSVRAHLVGIEQTEKNRYTVSIDGRRFASFCSEGRARAAGRSEARRLDFTASEARGSRPGAPQALPVTDDAS